MVRRHPLAAFFFLAYLGSWVAWSPWWLSQNGIGVVPFEVPFSAIAGINQLGLFAGPFAAALLVTRITEGRDGLRRLLRMMVQWRAHPGWYLLALVTIPLATGIGYLLTSEAPLRAGGGIPVLAMLTITHLAYLVLVVSMSFVMSWLVNGSRGSVMLAILGHNSINWALFASGTFTGQPIANNWPGALGLAALAVIAVVATRGRLGIERHVA